MIAKMAHTYEEKYGEPMERVNLPQFIMLCKSYGSLIVYPAMGMMERLMGMVSNCSCTASISSLVAPNRVSVSVESPVFQIDYRH